MTPLTSEPAAKPTAQARVEGSGVTDALPVAPGLGLALEAAHLPRKSTLAGRRVVLIAAVAVVLAIAAAFIARILMALIGLVTNLAFFGRWSMDFVAPAPNALGPWVILVPAVGGLAVGVMARWGSQAIRGHGIPEAMEQVLLNQSRIAPRVMFLKPVSSAIAIGTGGPFGAEGPIIATGGALGSVIGQFLKVTANERKTLLAAGAAAGMAAVFGSPVSAVILAVELLLFELRPRSLIPVAMAAFAATAVRWAMVGSHPVFAMPDVAQPGGGALTFYVAIGALLGLASVIATRVVYHVEELFDRLPVHWMWWPAIGGIVVGFIGWIDPQTLGVGYTNIEGIVAGRFTVTALLVLCFAKFVSWAVALGSGTSGGTLAPLFMVGGALGAAVGHGLAVAFPHVGIDPRIAGLVGMAAMFAGASRALLTSIVFAFETTLQPFGLLPLLGGCAAAYLISALTMRNTIMTEKIARRGVRVPTEYEADFLDRILVRDAAAREVVTLHSADELGEVRRWVASGKVEAQREAFPVIDDAGHVRGLFTRRDLFETDAAEIKRIGDLLTRPPVVVFEDNSLREAADHMARENIGQLIVVDRAEPRVLRGILTRADLIAAHGRRLHEAQDTNRHIRLRDALGRRSPVHPGSDD